MSQAPGWPLATGTLADPAVRRQALSGKVAVVTGASRGLGAGLAAHFAAAGLELGLCARHRPELAVATRPRAHDGVVEPATPALCQAVDVADHGQLEAFASAVVERFGRIDLWVNNAGLLEPMGPLADARPAALARLVEVNVTGVLFGSAVFARHVRARPGGGVLVNISSGAATRPYAGWAPYGASKAAVELATEVVALEGRPDGLAAYAVSPGVVDTDMQAAVRATPAERFPEVGRFLQLHDDGAFTPAAEVAERLLELAFAGPRPEVVRLRVPPPGPGR